MKTLAAILSLLVVLLSIALFLLGGAYRDCRNLKSEQFDFAKIEVIEHAHQMANKDLALALLTKKMDSVTALHSKSQGSLINRLVSAKKPILPIGSFTTDSVKSQINHRDTVIALQDTLIDDLQKEKAAVWANFSQQVDTLKDKVRLSEDYSTRMEKKLEVSQDDLQDLKDKQYGIGGMVGVDQQGRPVISIGIYRNIWRFSLKKKRK
jgi:hypothetical protein